MRKVKAIIPARLESHRLPRKLLLADTGKPLIQHTYEAVKKCSRLDDVLVATDSREIEEVVRGFGGQVVMTGEASNGTERVYQATQVIEEDPDTLIINVQGDEPTIKPNWINRLISDHYQTEITTLANPLSEKEKQDPSKVKVVFRASNFNALYFSRAPIPYKGVGWEHIGIYAYTVRKLAEYMELRSSSGLEQAEDLEQLRALDAGWEIHVVPVIGRHSIGGIDTQEDYNRFVEWYKRQ